MPLNLITSIERRDPFRHMALEEYCFRNDHLPMPLVLIYINDPAVVIGRNQNGWLETNGPFLASQNIPIVRRITGGGTVYHDSGNLNIAVIADYGRRGLAAADPWVDTLSALLTDMGVSAHRTVENDLLIANKKISGHARYTNTRRWIAHSSLLMAADLDRLRSALQPSCQPVHSRAVASRPSPVTNVVDHLAGPLTMLSFIQALTDGFNRRFGPTQPLVLTQVDTDAVDALARDRFRSWQWTFGRTPPFEIDARIPTDTSLYVRLTVHDGIIRTLTFPRAHPSTQRSTQIRNKWIGSRFHWQWVDPQHVTE